VRSDARHGKLKSMKCKALNDKVARNVIRDLNKGFGIQDIAVRNTATEEQARFIVDFLREHKLLGKFYTNSRRKWGNANTNDSRQRG
jgi:hypothetical protein